MIRNINVEAEHNELILKNEYGDYVIIPADKRNLVSQKLRSQCFNCIDDIVETLPSMQKYAPDGSIYPEVTPGYYAERLKKIISKNPDKTPIVKGNRLLFENIIDPDTGVVLPQEWLNIAPQKEIKPLPIINKTTPDPKIVSKQKLLKDAGLYKGELDGIWGSKSEVAWKEYNKPKEETVSKEKIPYSKVYRVKSKNGEDFGKSPYPMDEETIKKYGYVQTEEDPLDCPECMEGWEKSGFIYQKPAPNKNEIIGVNQYRSDNWNSTIPMLNGDIAPSKKGSFYYIITTKDNVRFTVTTEEYEDIKNGKIDLKQIVKK